MSDGCALCGAQVETAQYLFPLGPGREMQVLNFCQPCAGLPDAPCAGCGQPAHTWCTWVDFLETGACCDQPICDWCWQEVRFLNGTWTLWCPHHVVPRATEECA